LRAQPILYLLCPVGFLDGIANYPKFSRSIILNSDQKDMVAIRVESDNASASSSRPPVAVSTAVGMDLGVRHPSVSMPLPPHSLTANSPHSFVPTLANPRQTLIALTGTRQIEKPCDPCTFHLNFVRTENRFEESFPSTPNKKTYTALNDDHEGIAHPPDEPKSALLSPWSLSQIDYPDPFADYEEVLLIPPRSTDQNPISPPAYVYTPWSPLRVRG